MRELVKVRRPDLAIDFTMGDIEGSFDSTITIGGARRMRDPSCSITGDSAACAGTANTAQWSAGDDGDLNYKKGDWYAVTAERGTEPSASAASSASPNRASSFSDKNRSRFSSLYLGTWRQGLEPSARRPQTSARLNILERTRRVRLA